MRPLAVPSDHRRNPEPHLPAVQFRKSGNGAENSGEP